MSFHVLVAERGSNNLLSVHSMDQHTNIQTELACWEVGTSLDEVIYFATALDHLLSSFAWPNKPVLLLHHMHSWLLEKPILEPMPLVALYLPWRGGTLENRLPPPQGQCSGGRKASKSVCNICLTKMYFCLLL